MGKFDSRVDSVFADIDVHSDPGAALLVIDHGEILCCRCYGLADLDTGRPITTDTSFYLASLSKQFTGMAIMLLAEQGKLDFNDRLHAYLRSCLHGARTSLFGICCTTHPACRITSSSSAPANRYPNSPAI
jgi:CubicO group peptidase (beta-lactamase class C family)